MSTNSQHKGNRGEAYLFYLGIMADDTFEPSTFIPQLFNEQNFTEEELLDIAGLVYEAKGAQVVSSHPNATQRVKAKLVLFTIEALSVVEETTDL